VLGWVPGIRDKVIRGGKPGGESGESRVRLGLQCVRKRESVTEYLIVRGTAGENDLMAHNISQGELLSLLRAKCPGGGAKKSPGR